MAALSGSGTGTSLFQSMNISPQSPQQGSNQGLPQTPTALNLTSNAAQKLQHLHSALQSLADQANDLAQVGYPAWVQF